jgi:hypothetical protein
MKNKEKRATDDVRSKEEEGGVERNNMVKEYRI